MSPVYDAASRALKMEFIQVNTDISKIQKKEEDEDLGKKILGRKRSSTIMLWLTRLRGGVPHHVQQRLILHLQTVIVKQPERRTVGASESWPRSSRSALKAAIVNPPPGLQCQCWA